MNGQFSFAVAAAIMFATGLGIPMLAALNGGLGRNLGSPAGASVVMFGMALALSLLVLAVITATKGTPDWGRLRGAPVVDYFGALFMVAYVLAVTTFAPRIGVGNAVFFVLLGQLVAAAAIDHFGWFGAVRFAMNARRLAGIAVMAAGVWLAKRAA